MSDRKRGVVWAFVAPVALGMAVTGAAKLLGDVHGSFLPGWLVIAGALLEVGVAVGVLLPKIRRFALLIAIALVLAWFVLGFFVIPEHASCGCFGGLKALEERRWLVAGAVGFCSVWALYFCSE